MAFLDTVSDVVTLWGLKRLINDLSDDQLSEALESLRFDSSVTRRKRCLCLRKRVEIYEGMSSRASNATSLTTDSTDQEDDKQPSDEAAGSAVTTTPVTKTVESVVTTTTTVTSAIGVFNPPYT